MPNSQYQQHLFEGKPLYSLKLVQESDVRFGPGDRYQVSAPDTAVEVLRDFFADSPKEKFVVMLLATNNTVIGLNVVSVGDLSSSVVSPREVFQPAILGNAAAVVVAHNHPSGNPEPSKQDIQVTRKLSDAGDTLSIPLHDSLIVTNHDYTSLANRGVV